MKHDSFPVTIRLTQSEIEDLQNLLGQKGISTKALKTRGRLLRAVISEVLNKVFS